MARLPKGDHPSHKSPLEEALRAYRVKKHPVDAAEFMRQTIDHLAAVPEEELQKLLRESLSKIDKAIRRSQPIELLSMLSIHFLTSIATHDKPLYEEGDVSQAHLEFLQALTLRIPIEEYEFSGIDQGERVVDTVVALLQEVFLAHSMVNHRKYPTLATQEERTQQIALDHLRASTQYLRNWGFPVQMKRILLELIEPLDDDFISLFGIKSTSLIGMLHALVEEVENRLASHFAQLTPIMSASTPNEAIDAYYESFPDIKGDPQALKLIAARNEATLRDIQLLFIAHSSLSYSSIFTFSIEDLSACCIDSPSPEELTTIMDEWSLGFGDLSTFNVDHLFLANPIWSKPFIKSDSGKYAVPIVGSLVSFSTDLLDLLIGKHTVLKSKYERRRADYLENAVADQMRRIFLDENVFTGSKWYPPEYATEGENDVLVIFDQIALIIEAKSSQPAPHALRGAYPSSKAILRKLAVESTEQGHKFAQALGTWRGVHHFSTRSGTTNVVDTSRLDLYLFYNVSFELLALSTVRSRMLQEADLLPDGFVLTPMATLAELELIIDILQDELQFLHYVSTRAKLEELDGLVADELDIFAYYMQGCPRINELLSTPELGMIINGLSKVVDIAVATEADLSAIQWPRTRRAQLFRSLIGNLRTTGTVGWVRVSMSLLSIPYSKQKALERDLRKLEKVVWKSRGQQCVRYKESSLEEWDFALTVVLFASRGFTDDEEREFAESVLSRVGRGNQESSTIVISSSSQRHHQPCVIYATPDYWQVD